MDGRATAAIRLLWLQPTGGRAGWPCLPPPPPLPDSPLVALTPPTHSPALPPAAVRRDNPRLTTRREGGHQPVRIVMSRTLDLPPDANLWDVGHAPTIVATQRGARQAFQEHLRSRGVEVLQFDFLTPAKVAE